MSPPWKSLLGGLASALILSAAVHWSSAFGWLVTAPVIAAISDVANQGTAWRGRRFAALAGIAFALATGFVEQLPWLLEAAQRYYGVSPWRGLAISLTLIVGVGSILGSTLGLFLEAALRTARRWAAVLGAGVVWGAWESLLVWGLPRYPWCSLASTQVQVAPAMALVGVGGHAALSGLMASVGAVLVVRARSGKALTSWRRSLRAAAALGLGLAVAWLFPGSRKLNSGPIDEGPCRVLAVDGDLQGRPSDSQAALARFAERMETSRGFPATLIAWPESSLTAAPEDGDETFPRLRAMAREWQAPLLVGGPRRSFTDDWSQRTFNSAHWIPPLGELGVYDKQRLVPFAEYWPPGFGTRPIWLGDTEISAGEAPGLFEWGGCRVGVLICFEVEAAWLVRELAAREVDLIVVLSNDASIPERTFATELRHAQLRAAESGVPLLRVANRGPSTVIDGHGQIRVESRSGNLLARVPPRVHADVRLAGGPLEISFAAIACCLWILRTLSPWIRRGDRQADRM